MRLRSGLGVLVAAAAFASLFVAYCNVYTPDLVDSGPPIPDGGGIGWWSGSEGQCFSAGTPKPGDRPAAQAGTDEPPIYLALLNMRLGSLNAAGEKDPNAWKDLGMDLDGVCTQSPTCLMDNPIVSCKPTGAAVPYDGNYCRDNTFGSLEYYAATIPEVGGKYGLNDDAFNCGLCTGAYNFLVRVSGYNGQPNDDHVRVDYYPSPGLDAPLPWDCGSTDWKNHPCFTPEMPWLVRDDSVTQSSGGPNLPDAVLADPNGYVRDGYIVTNLPKDTLFWFPFIQGRKANVPTPYPLKLVQAVVSGHLHKAQDGTWTIDDGVIAGRALGTDLVKGFRLIGFCQDDKNYTLMTNFLNNGLDILADGTVDANRTCDAMSVGIGFSARQATAGNLQHVDDPVECAQLDGGTLDGGTDAPSDGPSGG